MALDTQIPLQLRPVQTPNPMELYGNALQLQGGIQRNALLGLQMQQQQREAAADDALGNAYRNALTDGKIDRNALMAQLAGGAAASKIPGVQKTLLDADTAQAKLDETQAKLADRHLGVISGVFAPLANRPNVTREEVGRALELARASGVPEKTLAGIAATIPENSMMLPDAVRAIALKSENGRKALEMMLPKVHMQDTGGSVQALNTNPLAGSIGPIAGAGSITKTMTPEGSATNERALAAQAEAQRHNRVTEGISGAHLNLARQTADRGRWQYDAERGGRVNLDTGAFEAVTQGGQPIGQKLPEAQKKELTSIDAQRNQVAGAVKAVTETPGAFGMTRGLATMAGPISESVAGRVDSDAERQARSYVFNVVSKVINERAGAAQSKQELARLRAFLPAETDNADQIVSKLNGFDQYLQDTRKAYQQPVQTGAPPQVERSTAKEQKTINGKSYVKMNGQWYEDRRQ